MAAIASPTILTALRWLLTGAVLAALAWFGTRFVRRPTDAAVVADAAAVADRAADLKDELKSAYWLSGAMKSNGAAHGAFIELLVQRASASAQRLDARQVVPGTTPRAWVAAFAMAGVAAALAWWSPRWAPEVGPVAEANAQREPASKTVASTNPTADTRTAKSQPGSAADSAAAGTVAGSNDLDWAGLERAAKSLGHSEAGHALAAAIRNRDVRAAAAALEELKRDPAAAPVGDRSFAAVARPMRERAGQADAGAGRDLLSALGDLFRAQVNTVGLDADKSAEKNIKSAMEAAEQRAKENNQASPQTKAANPSNTNVVGTRSQGDDGEARINGQGEGNNPGGNSQPAEGGGQNVSLAAGGDGSNPADVQQSHSLANVAPAPLEGAKTQRLQAEIQRVRIDGQHQGEAANDGAEEKLYAATRAQRSALDYRVVAGAPRYTQEAATTGERVPLADRAVVRDYFLNQRRTER